MQTDGDKACLASEKTGQAYVRVSPFDTVRKNLTIAPVPAWP